MSKKLINSTTSVVKDSVEGLLILNPNLKRVGDLNVIVRSDILSYRENHVTVLSGGGSGHEPAHAGFIGEGMLSGAILGNVFASPSVSAILAAIRISAGPIGVLLVVKNYTGDRLNFGMALEIARQEGIKCAMVIVADDCALPEGKGITGGRGVAGTLFVHKISGASASRGCSLEEVLTVARWAAEHVGSMGVASTVCTVPGTERSTRLDDPSIIECGLGIHGEQGREQMTLPAENAAKILSRLMIDGIIGDLSGVSQARIPISSPARVALLINNLGGLPIIESLIVLKESYNYLLERNLTPIRVYSGAFMTSLEMNGVSVSLLMLPENDELGILSLLDNDTSVRVWHSEKLDNDDKSASLPYTDESFSKKIFGGSASPRAVEIVRAVCTRIIEIEPLLSRYDSICGDGDCGIVMKAGASFILDKLSDTSVQASVSTDAALLCDVLASGISSSMGGTSGALLELFFRSAATSSSSGASWPAALAAGVHAMKFYGGADVGMRTMLDSLIPGVNCLVRGEPLDRAAEEARTGMEKTKTMESLAGRANYVNKAQMEGTPDPGAVAVAEAFAAAAKVLI